MCDAIRDGVSVPDFIITQKQMLQSELVARSSETKDSQVTQSIKLPPEDREAILDSDDQNLPWI